jgi:uncharacterized membrane protein
MTPPTHPDRPTPPPAWHRWVLYAIVIVAVLTRFHALSAQSLWLDEIWGLEIAAGHDAEHQTLPVGQLLPSPPDLTETASARPAWAVWTHLDRVTGPPGSYLLLRAWIDAFGDSESAVRSLSAICSTLTVIVLFLAVRTWAGSEPALWAAALIAVAGPQVNAGQDARPYAPLMLLGSIALWAAMRTAVNRPALGRTVLLTATLLGLLLTHYFAVAAVAAVGLYGLVWPRGAPRRHLVGAVAAAGAVFTMLWGPFMLRQMAAFSPHDRAAAFLYEPGPGHVSSTLWRLLTLPASMLVDARPIPASYAVVGPLLYAAMATACLRRRRWPALWPLWFAMTVGLLAVLDLSRSTQHLVLLRYSLLASLAVYVAVAIMPSVHRALGRCVAAVAVAFAAWSLPTAYAPRYQDYRSLELALRASARPGELVVFAGPGKSYSPQILYLAASHYAAPLAGPVLLLDAPATPAVLRQVAGRPTVWMVADPEVRLAREWLPGYHLAAGQSWPVVGSLLRMERDG